MHNPYSCYRYQNLNLHRAAFSRLPVVTFHQSKIKLPENWSSVTSSVCLFQKQPTEFLKFTLKYFL